MADEVYKILQSRLRRNSQHVNCGDSPDCDACRKAKNSANEDLSGHSRKKARVVPPGGEDPLSHKIIEKRRRDRMNSCLSDLSHLIPSNYLKKGRGRIEKTEIVEMAIKHIKHLHQLMENQQRAGQTASGASADASAEQTVENKNGSAGSNWQCPQEVQSFRNGFDECLAEALHFLVDRENIPPENPLCGRLVTHLNKYLDQKTQEQQQQQQVPNTSQQQQHAGHSAGHSAKPAQQQLTEVVPVDSDYSSISSSAANSEVGSAVSSQSQPQANVQSNQQKNLQFRHFPSTSSSISLSDSPSTSSGIKRRKSEEVTGGKFKFKDSIRERFGKEFPLEHGGHTNAEANSGMEVSSIDYSMTSLASAASTASTGGRLRTGRSSSEHFNNDDTKASTSHYHHQSSSKDYKMEHSHHHHQIQHEYRKEKKNVPIFALHPKGSHYIPLEVSDEVINPYLHLFEQGSDLPLMLHPVTISVNFCGPVRMASRQYSWPQSQQQPQRHKSHDGSITVHSIKEDND